MIAAARQGSPRRCGCVSPHRQLRAGSGASGACPAVPAIDPGSKVSVIGGVDTLTSWQLSVDSWTQTPSGDPTQTLHTPIPATGTFGVSPLSGVTSGALPSWTAITPQDVPGSLSAGMLAAGRRASRSRPGRAGGRTAATPHRPGYCAGSRSMRIVSGAEAIIRPIAASH